MALTGLSGYRAYSQLANPYYDAPDAGTTNPGTSPYATGGGFTGTTYQNPTQTSNTAMTSALATSPAGTVAVKSGPGTSTKQTFTDLANSVKTRGGAPGTGTSLVQGGAQVGSALGGYGIAHGLLGLTGLAGSAVSGAATMGLGALAGLAINDYAKHKQHQSSDISRSDYEALVQAAYRDYLGREASPDEYTFKGGDWVNQNQYTNNLQYIMNSPEARAYAAGGGTSTVPTAPTGSTNTYTNPTFVQNKINEGFQQLYGRNATADEMAYWQGKMLTPDTFSDGKVRVGWNPYWQDRLLHPGADSSGVAAGDETVVGMGTPTTNATPNSSYLTALYNALGMGSGTSGIPFVTPTAAQNINTDALLSQLMSQLQVR